MTQLSRSPLDFSSGASMLLEWSLGDATESVVCVVALELRICNSLVFKTKFVLLITLRCIARSSSRICWVSYFLDIGHYSFGVGALQIRAMLCKAVLLLTLQCMASLDRRVSAYHSIVVFACLSLEYSSCIDASSVPSSVQRTSLLFGRVLILLTQQSMVSVRGRCTLGTFCPHGRASAYRLIRFLFVWQCFCLPCYQVLSFLRLAVF